MIFYGSYRIKSIIRVGSTQCLYAQAASIARRRFLRNTLTYTPTDSRLRSLYRKLGYSTVNYGFCTATVGNLQVRYGAGNLAHETSRSKKCHDEATDIVADLNKGHTLQHRDRAVSLIILLHWPVRTKSGKEGSAVGLHIGRRELVAPVRFLKFMRRLIQTHRLVAEIY